MGMIMPPPINPFDDSLENRKREYRELLKWYRGQCLFYRIGKFSLAICGILAVGLMIWEIAK